MPTTFCALFARKRSVLCNADWLNFLNDLPMIYVALVRSGLAGSNKHVTPEVYPGQDEKKVKPPMKKTKRATRRSLALPVEWANDGAFDLELMPVENVYAKGPNIIVLAFASSTDTAFFQPPQPPLAA